MDNTPIRLLSTMVNTDLFKRWQSKKAQVIAGYYKGRTSAGFTFWLEGSGEAPPVIEAPMWGWAAFAIRALQAA